MSTNPQINSTISELTESELVAMLSEAAAREPKRAYEPYEPWNGLYGEIGPATPKQIALLAKLAIEKDLRGYAVGLCSTFGFGALSQRAASQAIEQWKVSA